jgi:CxxC-x17-CxxC domain-containing protein
MGNFNRDRGGDRGSNRGGGYGDRGFKRDFRGGSSDRGGDRPRPELFRATCAECGKSCEVPFRPSGDKPVYCRDCFDKRGDRDGAERHERSFNRSSSFGDRGDREMFSAVCDSCGKKCEVPFRPSSDKPIYCSDCFADKGGGDRNDRGGHFEKRSEAPAELSVKMQEQLNTINGKLDRLLRAFELRGKIGKVDEIVIKAEAEKVEPKIEKPVKSEVKAEVKAKVKAAPKKKAVVKKKAVKKA